MLCGSADPNRRRWRPAPVQIGLPSRNRRLAPVEIGSHPAAPRRRLARSTLSVASPSYASVPDAEKWRRAGSFSCWHRPGVPWLSCSALLGVAGQPCLSCVASAESGELLDPDAGMDAGQPGQGPNRAHRAMCSPRNKVRSLPANPRNSRHVAWRLLEPRREIRLCCSEPLRGAARGAAGQRGRFAFFASPLGRSRGAWSGLGLALPVLPPATSLAWQRGSLTSSPCRGGREEEERRAQRQGCFPRSENSCPCNRVFVEGIVPQNTTRRGAGGEPAGLCRPGQASRAARPPSPRQRNADCKVRLPWRVR